MDNSRRHTAIWIGLQIECLDRANSRFVSLTAVIHRLKLAESGYCFVLYSAQLFAPYLACTALL